MYGAATIATRGRGNAILLDYHIARHHADIEAVFAYEGGDTMQALIVGREITSVQVFAPK